MIEAGLKKSIILQLAVWHFIEAPKAILFAWRNILIANFQYFSIGFLARTLFSHWRHYRDSYGRGFDAGRYAQTLVGNLISRILGALVRTVTIVIGLTFELFILVIGPIILIIWLFLPFLLIVGFAFSIDLII